MNSSVITVTLNPALDKTITIDELKSGGLNRVTDMRIDPGGKGINVAKVLKRFGVNVTAAGVIAGYQGEFILKYLEEEKIDAKFIKVDGETRTNLKVIENKTKITTEFNEQGFILNDEVIAKFEQELHGLLDCAEYLVLSGSLPRGVKDEVYKNYIEIAKAKGVKTILDADGKALTEGLKALPYAIKPNIHELEELVGSRLSNDGEVVRAARLLINDGINIVIVSKGADGSIVVGQNETYRVKTFPIVPKSTVGAGDSMVGVLAYSLLNNKSLAEAARWVTTAGTVTASKPGSQVCTLEEAQNNVNKVHLEKLL